ncbi:molybdenum cofactor guanylyltransferase [Wohlfahrtiimonas larvae]|uniref:Molybdenum cofactor guanylyltransferase n=1 Tax=Wohlfahrtiimonas larvae TaxID=1157986 RepID=A0ABP9MFG1_9GAMM|nr:molybdenum cofactor guanylyltransferase [Wohlfahrtiimonas larvae]
MSKVVGLILSGGAGSRLGGVNKGLVLVEGKPLVQWVYDVFSPQVDEVYISANEDISAYRAVSMNILSDEKRFYRDGPLSGMYSLRKIVKPEDIIQVVTCDLPLLPKDLVVKQLLKLREENLDAVYPRDDERAHYGLLMFKAKYIDEIESLLLDKQHRIRDFLAKMKCDSLFFDDSTAFINGNDWDAVAQITKILKERKC